MHINYFLFFSKLTSILSIRGISHIFLSFSIPKYLCALLRHGKSQSLFVCLTTNQQRVLLAIVFQRANIHVHTHTCPSLVRAALPSVMSHQQIRFHSVWSTPSMSWWTAYSSRSIIDATPAALRLDLDLEALDDASMRLLDYLDHNRHRKVRWMRWCCVLPGRIRMVHRAAGAQLRAWQPCKGE